jgi:hypothetical protein
MDGIEEMLVLKQFVFLEKKIVPGLDTLQKNFLKCRANANDRR